jgi:hypothetical protein
VCTSFNNNVFFTFFENIFFCNQTRRIRTAQKLVRVDLVYTFSNLGQLKKADFDTFTISYYTIVTG